MRWSTLTPLVLLTFLLLVPAQAEMNWQVQNQGLDETDILTIAVCPGQSDLLAAASEKSLYHSRDGGASWEEVFSLQGEGEEIRHIAFHNQDPTLVYAATSQGIYAIDRKGGDWQKIFSSVSEAANDTYWIETDGSESRRLYIGSADGLRYTPDGGNNWTKAEGLPHAQVLCIAVDPLDQRVLFLANTRGLYKSPDQGRTWRRVLVTVAETAEETQDESAEEETDSQNLINGLAFSKKTAQRVYAASGSGVYCSEDAGETWEKFSSLGLISDFVNFVTTSADGEETLYAATKNGVFRYIGDEGRWRQMHQGMAFQQVHSLVLVPEAEVLFAASDKGVFKAGLKPLPKVVIPSQVKIKGALAQAKPVAANIDFEHVLRELEAKEPSIQEIQQAALSYAEVIHPEQIRDLRRSARLSAFLPDVSLDYDKTIQAGGTGNNFGRFAVGPREWGVSLSWDVGDIIFSEQVRLIDSNARLLVQLRDDILNEITRLYYERRKLQTELVVDPPQTAQEKFAKVLRLKELTANIDALSGGYLSRQVQK